MSAPNRTDFGFEVFTNSGSGLASQFVITPSIIRLNINKGRTHDNAFRGKLSMMNKVLPDIMFLIVGELYRQPISFIYVNDNTN